MTNRWTHRVALLSSLLSLAGCASDARLAAAERRIDVLQRHVIALEAVILDDDGGDEPITTQLALATTRPAPSTRPAAESAARLDARRAACLANLANVETVAYRSRTVVGDANGGFATVIRTEPGPLRNTGRQLDVAINGDGFFCLHLADGTPVYTRSGNFFIDNNGTLVLGSRDGGRRVMPSITLPPETTNVTISDDGTLATYVKNTPAAVVIGRFQLARFADASRLAPIDATCFAPTDASGPASIGSPGDAGFGVVEQQFLEQSNVFAEGERATLRDVERIRDRLR